MIQDPVRRLLLGHFVQCDGPAEPVKNRDDVGVALKTGALVTQVVGNDHVHIFPDHFLPGIGQQVLGFHGKSHQDAFVLFRADVGNDIGVAHKLDAGQSPVFFDFLAGRNPGPVIGHRGGFDDDRCFGTGVHDGPVHFLRGAHKNDGFNFRGSNFGGPADERHLRASLVSGLRQRVAHFAR